MEILKTRLWQGSKGAFNLMRERRELIRGTIYFVGDSSSSERAGLDGSDEGVIFYAVSDASTVKFGAYNAEDNIQELAEKVDNLMRRMQDAETAIDDLTDKDTELEEEINNLKPIEKFVTQEYTNGSQLQKVFSLSNNGSVIMHVVCSVSGRVWADTLYYSNSNYTSTGYFYTNYHKVFIESRLLETIAGAVCINTKRSPLAPAMRMYLRIVKLNGTITWYENEYKNAGNYDVLNDKVSASVDLSNATNLSTDSEGNITNEIGESVSSLADGLLYTMNASASGGAFTIPYRDNYSGTKIYCFGAGNATLNGNTLSYENGNTIVLEGGSITIETADKDYYTKEESDERYELKGRPADKVFTIQNSVRNYRSYYIARWKRYDYPVSGESSVSYNSIRKFRIRVTRVVGEYDSPVVADVTFLYSGYVSISVGNTGTGSPYIITDGTPVNKNLLGDEGEMPFGEIGVYQGHFVTEENKSYNYLGFVTWQSVQEPRNDTIKVEVWNEGFYHTDGKDDAFEWLDGQVHTSSEGYPTLLVRLSGVAVYEGGDFTTLERKSNKVISIDPNNYDSVKYPSVSAVVNFVNERTVWTQILFSSYQGGTFVASASERHFYITQTYGSVSIVDISAITDYHAVIEIINTTGSTYSIKYDQTTLHMTGCIECKVTGIYGFWGDGDYWRFFKSATLTEIQ